MSPYENRLNAEEFRRIALIAEIKPGNAVELAAVLSCRPEALETELAQAGISHLHLYQKDLGTRCVLFVYFETTSLDQEAAVHRLKVSSSWWSEVEVFLNGHPRALEADRPWMRAEFINVIADNTDRERATGKAMGLVAGLHMESELWYRTLHQTNWPGVIDQMQRSHYQNWTTFMLEWGSELLLFTHAEYMGTDQAADDALMAEDPVTRRWWVHTQPCLYSLIPGHEAWVAMD